MIKRYKSCFIVDISIDSENHRATLYDSAHMHYNVDLKNVDLAIKFKTWFKNIFLKGVAQTLTVIEYSSVSISECENEYFVVDFINAK